MSSIGQPERVTQDRAIALFVDELGYRYLGDWTDREGNSNIEEGLLSEWLTWSGYSRKQIGVALHQLCTEAGKHGRGLNQQPEFNEWFFSTVFVDECHRTQSGKDLCTSEHNRRGLAWPSWRIRSLPLWVRWMVSPTSVKTRSICLSSSSRMARSPLPRAGHQRPFTKNCKTRPRWSGSS